MLMTRHELTVVSMKELEQLNYPRLVVVSKACQPRAGAGSVDTPPRRSMTAGICRVEALRKEGNEINAHSPRCDRWEPLGCVF